MVSKSKQGFTMMEVVVVVAIVGVATYMTMNRFDAMRSQARQKEVQIQGAALFTAERNFFAANGTFTTCLPRTGFKAIRDSGNAPQFYAAGFDAVTTVSATCGPPPGAAIIPCNTYDYTQVPAVACPVGEGASPANQSPNENIAARTQADLVGIIPAGSVTLNTLTVGFTGVISTRPAGVAGNLLTDNWIMQMNTQITNRPNFQNIQNGL